MRDTPRGSGPWAWAADSSFSAAGILEPLSGRQDRLSFLARPLPGHICRTSREEPRLSLPSS